MKLLLSLFVWFIVGFSYSQEKTKEKAAEVKEIKALEKELKKKTEDTAAFKNLIQKRIKFKAREKELIIETQNEYNLKKALENLERFQELQSIIEDEGKEDENDQLPETEVDAQVEKAVIRDAVFEDTYFEDTQFEFNRDRTRLTGPSQYDSRIEIRELSGEIDWQWLMLQRNKSVGMVIEKTDLKLLAKGVYQLRTSYTLASKFNICKEEAFTDQPVVGVGTSFIIDDNQMITAQHVFTKSLENYVVVFGYELFNQTGLVEAIFTEADIYYPKNIVKTSKELDVTIFEVDREFEDREPLEWKESKDLKKGREVYLIGHPTGLPKKVALNASILDNANQQYFYTSLDSFQGNSGSPVFDFVSHKVIGVLVSGEVDYNFNGNCYESNLCKVPYCKGEKVIRIENILNN